MELIHPIFKWLHIIAGIVWIGLLYFFNFINGHVAATMDGDTKKKVVPELMPRALYWFRWGAAWTWVTGVVLLIVIFWINGLMPDDFTPVYEEVKIETGVPDDLATPEVDESVIIEDGQILEKSNKLIHFMLLFTFLSVFIYDFLYKSPLAKNTRLITIISFILIGLYVYTLKHCAGFEYRTFNIHLGAMFGTIMAFNVWFRIWPAQQKIITAIKNGEAPDSSLVALAGLRSKHNTYMSIPLIWTMINQHTTYFSGVNLLGIDVQYGWLVLMGFVALGWHIVWQLYKKSGKIKGF